MIKGEISLYLFVLGKWHQHFLHTEQAEEGGILTMLQCRMRSGKRNILVRMTEISGQF